MDGYLSELGSASEGDADEDIAELLNGAEIAEVSNLADLRPVF
jgi:hypothetical protein